MEKPKRNNGRIITKTIICLECEKPIKRCSNLSIVLPPLDPYIKKMGRYHSSCLWKLEQEWFESKGMEMNSIGTWVKKSENRKKKKAKPKRRPKAGVRKKSKPRVASNRRSKKILQK